MQYTPHYPTEQQFRGVTCVKLSGTLANIRKLMAMSDIQDVRPNVGRWCLRKDEVYWLVGMILKAPFTFSSHLSVWNVPNIHEKEKMEDKCCELPK